MNSRPRDRNARDGRLVHARTAHHHPRPRRHQLRGGGHRRSRAGVRHQRRADNDGGGGHAVRSHDLDGEEGPVERNGQGRVVSG